MSARFCAGVTLPPNPIQDENSRTGTREWLLDRPAPVTAGVRSEPIEAYCSASSVRAGDTLTVYASTNPESSWSLDLYRMGFYGGTGGRHLAHHGSFQGFPQLSPAVSEYRIRACDWAASLSLVIPDDWLSGMYLGKLTEHTGGCQSYITFIVKDTRDADLLFQCSDLTWQCYNRWPDLYSIYEDGASDWLSFGPGVGVSFQRPYGRYPHLFDAPLSTGSGEWLLWECPFAYWAEEQGYDITYISNLDLHSQPSVLDRTRGLLSAGHDEYYSIEMYAVNGGLNVAFFSGNSVYGQMAPLEDPPRSFVRVDVFTAKEPEMWQMLPTMADLPYVAPDARDLVGSRSVYPVMGGADWTCVQPDHWVFAGTGMQYGEGIAGLVGWEANGLVSETRNVEVIATGTMSGSEFGSGPYAATVYEAEHGNLVFNAATIYWADGLSEPPGYLRPEDYVPRHGPDSRVQTITRNVLERFIGSPRLRERSRPEVT